GRILVWAATAWRGPCGSCESSVDERRVTVMSIRTVAFACVVLSLVTMSPRPVTAQTRGGVSGTDPMVGPVVTGEPFSAEAVTTVTQTLSDGSRIEQRTSAKFYRDGGGRVRREQSI